MEVAGALVLWETSVERLNLRYFNVISDGDSKSIKALQKRAFIDLTSLETVDVLKKRAVKGQRGIDAVYEQVTRKVTIGGRGGITKKKYITMQQYYGNAIRANKGDLEGMV